MEPINILRAIDGGNHTVGIDVFRQRQLHQNPVHVGIGIQFSYQAEQLRLRNRLGTPQCRIADAYLAAAFALPVT